MPLYEYKCHSCGQTSEFLQKVDAPAPATCPECHSHEMVKVVSSGYFQLKGGGWYETDFKKKKKKTESDSASSKQDTTQTSNTDSKTSSDTTKKSDTTE